MSIGDEHGAEHEQRSERSDETRAICTMAALEDRRQRWKCPECGIVNRSWREECFGEDCDVKYERRMMQLESAADDVLVEFKDENSRVIAKIPLRIAAAIKSDLEYVVSRLVKSEEYSQNKHMNLKSTDALQRQMRTGQQVIEDFENQGALWGYARRKFCSRSVMSYELFSSARNILLASDCKRCFEIASILDANVSSVVSIGGGPGNDMFGYLLFQRHELSSDNRGARGAAAGERPPPRLHVFDFAQGWKPIVARVAELSNRTIQFQMCNLKEPLQEDSWDSSTNQSILEFLDAASHDSSPVVFLFCYVLSEVMGPYGNTPPLLEDLFMYHTSRGNGALFLFREPHTQALQTLLSRHEDWCEGRDFWNLSNGGIMIWMSP